MAHSPGTVVFYTGYGLFPDGEILKIINCTTQASHALINTYDVIDKIKRTISISGEDILQVNKYFSIYLDLILGMSADLTKDWLTSIGIRKIIDILKCKQPVSKNMIIFIDETIGKSYMISKQFDYEVTFEFSGNTYSFVINQEDIDIWSATLFEDIEKNTTANEPKNNDGRDTCFWCNAKTKKVGSIMSTWDICVKCGK